MSAPNSENRLHSAPRSEAALTWAGITTLLAGIVWVLLIIGLTWIVPKQRKMLDEFQMMPPVSTQLMFDVSMWLADYWWVLTPFMIVVALVVFLFTYLIRRHVRSRIILLLWLLLLLVP